MKQNKLLYFFIGVAVALTFAATEYDLQKGVDLTGRSSVTASSLNQLVDNAVVGTNKGMIIYQSTAPDTTNNTRYSRFLWLDSSTTPASLKVYDGSVWTNSAVTAGSITATSLADDAVTEAKILDGAVTALKINTGAVGSSQLGSGAVLLDRMGADSVDASKIVNGSITGADMLGRTINSTNIILATIAGEVIAGNTITSTNMAANSIYTTNIVDATITGTDVAGATLTYTNMATNAVAVTNISPATGGAGQVLGVNLAGNAVAWQAPWVTSVSFANATGTAGHTASAHGLGFTPRIYAAVLVAPAGGDRGWSADDEVRADAFGWVSGTTLMPAFSLYAESTNVGFTLSGVGSLLRMQHKTTVDDFGSAPSTNWTLKVYLSR